MKNENKQLKSKVEAAVAKALEPEAVESATSEVVQVLDKIDLANPPKELDDCIDKRFAAKS